MGKREMRKGWGQRGCSLLFWMTDTVHCIANYFLLLWRGFVCLFCGVVVSLSFIVGRDGTLKKLPEKLADFVFNSHWGKDHEKKELCWTLAGSCTVVFQKALKPEHTGAGLLGTILQDLVWFPLKGQRGHSQIQSCWFRW